MCSLFPAAGELRASIHTSDVANEQAIQKVTLQVRAQLAAQANMKNQEGGGGASGSPKMEAILRETATPREQEASVSVKANGVHRQESSSTKDVVREPGLNPTAAAAPQKAQELTEKVVVKEQEERREGDRKPAEKDVTQGSHQTNDKETPKQTEAKARHQPESTVVANGNVKQAATAPKNQNNKPTAAEAGKQNGVGVGGTGTSGAGGHTGGSGGDKKKKKEAVRASLTLPSVGRPAPPTITLEPLDVRGPGSGDEVQSMEVR